MTAIIVLVLFNLLLGSLCVHCMIQNHKMKIIMRDMLQTTTHPYWEGKNVLPVLTNKQMQELYTRIMNNSYSKWKGQISPEKPTKEQIERLIERLKEEPV